MVPPHAHAPLEPVCPFTHEPHAAPPVPHVVDDCADWATHWPVALQQPSGQVVALQMHVPVVLQVVPDPHAAHATPPVPHVVTDCTLYSSHWPLPLQQPFAHVVGPHPAASAATSDGASMVFDTSGAF